MTGMLGAADDVLRRAVVDYRTRVAMARRYFEGEAAARVERKVYEEEIARLEARVAELEGALGRTADALRLAIAGKPVRNADEILARAALAAVEVEP